VTTTKIELIGATQDRLIVDCTKALPEGDLDDYHKAAHADATLLFQALNGMIPYGTWSAFLALCRKEPV
jgi:hypothetical protein